MVSFAFGMHTFHLLYLLASSLQSNMFEFGFIFHRPVVAYAVQGISTHASPLGSLQTKSLYIAIHTGSYPIRDMNLCGYDKRSCMISNRCSFLLRMVQYPSVPAIMAANYMQTRSSPAHSEVLQARHMCARRVSLPDV